MLRAAKWHMAELIENARLGLLRAFRHARASGKGPKQVRSGRPPTCSGSRADRGTAEIRRSIAGDRAESAGGSRSAANHRTTTIFLGPPNLGRVPPVRGASPPQIQDRLELESLTQRVQLRRRLSRPDRFSGVDNAQIALEPGTPKFPEPILQRTRQADDEAVFPRGTPALRPADAVHTFCGRLRCQGCSFRSWFRR